MLTQALILAGQTPGPLPVVGGKPFLEYLVWNLGRHGVTDIVLCAGHDAKRIREHCGDGARLGVRLSFVAQATSMGTGNDLKQARDLLAEEFLVIDGDTLFDINYLDLALVRARGDALAALALRAVDDAPRFGAVILDGERVIGFGETAGSGPGLGSGGICAMRRQALDWLPDRASSIERDLLPGLAAAGRLAGQAYGGYFLDIGLPGTLARARYELPVWERKPAVFFDRDGVLNFDYGYVDSPERWDWITGAPEAVKRCNDLGYLVFVVTNQAGIGRGYYSEAQFQALMAWARAELREMGGHLDAVYHCPHHPTQAKGRYRQACACRKPGPGLIKQALRQWPVDPGRSLLVGDSQKDLDAAAAAGIVGYRFTQANLLEFMQFLTPVAHPSGP